MKYKVSVIKKIAFLVMTMALAVAMVACQAAVGKPGEADSPDKAAEPPTKTGIGSLSLRPGITETINLNDYFSDPEGEALSYDVESSDPAKVMATETGGTLTLVANSVGMARVTVIATDSAMETVSDTFTVTVETECRSPVSLYIDGTYECTLPSGYTLSTGAAAVVDVSPKLRATDNVWVITAEAKGKATVYILTDAGANDRSIVVNVGNRPPERKDKDNPFMLADPMAPAIAAPLDYTVLVTELNLLDYFDDQDGEVTTLKFKAEHVRNGKVLFKLDSNGYMAVDEDSYTYQVFSKAAGVDYFTIDFYAYDSSNVRSDEPVTIRLRASEVVAAAEPVPFRQDIDGGFEKDKVAIDGRLGEGQRIDLTAVVGKTGFRFAEKFKESLVASGKVNMGSINHASSEVIKEPVGTPAAESKDNAPAGTDYYEVTVVSGPGEVAFAGEPPALNEPPSIVVTPSAPGTIKISITYHVWVDKDGTRANKATAGALGDKWESKSEMLTVMVKNCIAYDCK